MKIARHRKILELISNNDVTTQEELASLLIDSNYIVTQATVSRDIRELGLTKMSVNGGPQKYVAIENNEKTINDKLLEILRAGYVSMDAAQNILVIKTVSGMAMAVAAALEALKWNEIVGCIAGDDTIMCAIRTNGDVITVMNKLNKIISY